MKDREERKRRGEERRGEERERKRNQEAAKHTRNVFA